MNIVTHDDGRTVAYAEWGDPTGRPLFSLHGTPGCRLSRRVPGDPPLPSDQAGLIPNWAESRASSAGSETPCQSCRGV